MKRAAIIIGAALLPFVFVAFVGLVSSFFGIHPGPVFLISLFGLIFAGLAFLATADE